MLPRCEFCGDPAVKLCSSAECTFNPFLCESECISSASTKVHAHKNGNEETINLRSFEILLSRKKQGLENESVNIEKLIIRITQKIKKTGEQYQKQIKQMFELTPEAESILRKVDGWSTNLTGQNINFLINKQLHNSQTEKGKMIKKLSEDLCQKLMVIEKVISSYLSFDQRFKMSEEMLRKSLRLTQQKKYQQSLEILEKTQLINPLNIDVTFEIAYCLDKLGKKKQAILEYLKAADLSLNTKGSSYNNIGSIYFESKQFQNSLQYYSKAIECDIDNCKFYFNRGNVYDYMGQPMNAIKDYSKAIELNSDNASYFCNRGNCYMATDQYELALIDYSSAISLSQNPNYYFNRQIALKKLGVAISN